MIFNSLKGIAIAILSLAIMTRYAFADEHVELGCTADLEGYYFNLHALSKPLNE